jgi:hypothetical protein
MTTQEIRTLVSNQREIKITIGTLKFHKYNNGLETFRMDDLYNSDKWNIYNNEAEFIKAIAAKIRYEQKKGVKIPAIIN